jgi:hypothetical protein
MPEVPDAGEDHGDVVLALSESDAWGTQACVTLFLLLRTTSHVATAPARTATAAPKPTAIHIQVREPL